MAHRVAQAQTARDLRTVRSDNYLQPGGELGRVSARRERTRSLRGAVFLDGRSSRITAGSAGGADKVAAMSRTDQDSNRRNLGSSPRCGGAWRAHRARQAHNCRRANIFYLAMRRPHARRHHVDREQRRARPWTPLVRALKDATPVIRHVMREVSTVYTGPRPRGHAIPSLFRRGPAAGDEYLTPRDRRRFKQGCYKADSVTRTHSKGETNLKALTTQVCGSRWDRHGQTGDAGIFEPSSWR